MPESSPDGWVLSDAALQKVIKAVRRTLGRPLNQRDDRTAGGKFGPLHIKAATNNSGATVSPHDVVAVSTAGGTAFTVGDELYGMTPAVVQATTNYAKQYGIVVGESVENGETALISLSGGPVNYTGTVPVNGQSVGPVSGSFAVSTTGAPYFTVVGVSTQFSLVDVVPYQPATISPVTLGAQLANDASVTVTLSDGRQVSATNKSGQTLEAGNALCVADPYTGLHYITGSALPSTSGGGAPSTGQTWFYGTVTLAADPNMANGFNVDNVVTLDGSTWPATTFQINNPLQLTGGEDDPVLFVESSTSRSFSPTGYTAVNILRRQPRRFYATLTSSGLKSFDGSATVESIASFDGAPATTVTSITNSLGWSGAGGDFCVFTEILSSTGSVSYLLEHVAYTARQMLVASTWNSTSLVHNYIEVPMPAPDATGTTVVFNTTQATAVQSVTTTGITLVRFDRPLTVFAAGASTQVTIATGTTCST